MTKTTKRTDPHRPGAIVPAEYEYVLSYHLATTQDGWPIPSLGIDCGQHLPGGKCCVFGLRLVARVKFASTGATGKCSICGAVYTYGDVWRHLPTGEHLHVGHTCAEKYELLADRSAYELEAGRRRAAAAKEITRHKNAEERRAFLDARPGLEEALKTDHDIVRDIAQRFTEYRSLSDKQVGLVLKIAREAVAPRQAEEVRVSAPEGKATFRGRVVSVKEQDSQFGPVWRMTVKVTTPEGVWLAWGTAPAGLFSAIGDHDTTLRGCEVEVTCTLKPGRELGFAIMSRPRGRVIKKSCSPSCRQCESEQAKQSAF